MLELVTLTDELQIIMIETVYALLFEANQGSMSNQNSKKKGIQSFSSIIQEFHIFSFESFKNKLMIFIRVLSSSIVSLIL